MKKGRNLELLIKKIEDVLGKDSNQEVTSPCLLADKISGQLRELDVVVVMNNSHHKTVIAFECKDYSRPVGVSVVEAFQTKVKSCDINIAILVATKGFTKQAKLKAQFYNIHCFTLEEVDQLPQILGTAAVYLTRTEFKIVKVNAFLDGIENLELLDSRVIKAPDGTVVNDKVLISNIENYLNSNHINGPLVGEEYRFFKFKTPDFYIESEVLNRKVIVNRIEVAISMYSVNESFPFRKMAYKGANDSRIADVAIAEIDTPKLKGDFTIIWDEKGGQVVFTPLKQT
jgi:hypothetical protein